MIAKKENSRIAIFGLAILIPILFYMNCGPTIVMTTTSQGTSTLGNPLAPTANKILVSLCNVLVRCHSGLSAADCQSGILETKGFSMKFGLTSSFDQFSQIILGEQNGSLTGNHLASSSCSESIDNLSCANPAVANAHDQTQANPFQQTPSMIPANSCNQSFTQPTYQSVIIADTPIGYWRFEETSGNVAGDTMGNNNGAIVGSVALGILGALSDSSRAARFSYTDPGYIDLMLNSINTTPGQLVSVEFWMRWSGSGTGLMPFGFDPYGLWLFYGPNPSEFGFNTGNGDRYGIGGPPVSSLTNNWVHIVAVMVNMAAPSDITKSKLYINGVPQTLSQTAGLPVVRQVTPKFRISSWAQDTDLAFDGDLDEFAVYNFELTPAQISRHYQAGLSNF